MNNLSQLVPTEGNKVTSTDTTDISCTKFDNDVLYAMLGDLVNNDFRKWYCKQFYRLGRDRVLLLASTARADAKTDKRRYFSRLLKNAD